MRATICGIFMVAGLTITALVIWIEGNPVHAQRNPLQQRMGKGLLALTVPAGPDKEFVALVDPIQKVMGVYQVDAEFFAIAKCNKVIETEMHIFPAICLRFF